MKEINIEGKKYTVTENLGFQGGYHAKLVDTPDGEKVAVKRGGDWTWWTAIDRLQPSSRPMGMSNASRKNL